MLNAHKCGLENVHMEVSNASMSAVFYNMTRVIVQIEVVASQMDFSASPVSHARSSNVRTSKFQHFRSSHSRHEQHSDYC